MAANDAFTAGVRPGGLTNSTEIRLLLCYLVKNAGPIARQEIENALMEEALVNYFEIGSCLDDITRQQLVTVQDNVYSITDKGRKVAQELAYDLPRSVRERAVVDIVGKILTPALLIGLLILIVVGVVSPIGPVGDQALVENVAATGIEAGYQTMDVLATLLFGFIILKSAQAKGYTKAKAQIRVVSGASLVAGIGLLVVYLGLTYLGATTANLFDITVDRTYLVTSIVQQLLGHGGLILFAIVVALACITTAVGLVSACANYFSGLSGGRLSYPVLVCLICLFSAVVSNFGINEIIAILSVVYPPTLALIVLALFGRRIRNDWVFRLAALGALVISLLEVISSYTGLEIAFLSHLPLASLGFAWVVPALLCGVIGHFIPHGKKKSLAS